MCWHLRFGALVFWIAAGLSCSVVRAEDPARVTTDTAEYCEQLRGAVGARLHVLPNPPVEALALYDEGGGMCAAGHVRGGIARLRRAMRVLHTGAAAAAKVARGADVPRHWPDETAPAVPAP